MQELLERAEAILRAHPAPSMSLIDLWERLREIGTALVPSCTRLRSVLEGNPDRFLVLDPWGRPWLEGAGCPSGEQEGVAVVCLDPGDVDPGPLSATARMRESVRWMARGTDVRSKSSVARLYSVLVDEAEVRGRLTKKAA